MQHIAEITGTPVKPDWIRHSNTTDEALQDVWQEAFDPENEYGEAVTAHYACTMQDGEPWLDMLGIEVEGDSGIRYVSRRELFEAGFDCPEFDRWEVA